MLVKNYLLWWRTHKAIHTHSKVLHTFKSLCSFSKKKKNRINSTYITEYDIIINGQLNIVH